MYCNLPPDPVPIDIHVADITVSDNPHTITISPPNSSKVKQILKQLDWGTRLILFLFLLMLLLLVFLVLFMILYRDPFQLR